MPSKYIYGGLKYYENLCFHRAPPAKSPVWLKRGGRTLHKAQKDSQRADNQGRAVYAGILK